MVSVRVRVRIRARVRVRASVKLRVRCFVIRRVRLIASAAWSQGYMNAISRCTPSTRSAEMAWHYYIITFHQVSGDA